MQYLKEENVKIPEKYKIDFNKKYKYIAKIDDHDDSKLYLIYISDEKRIYIVENIYQIWMELGEIYEFNNEFINNIFNISFNTCNISCIIFSIYTNTIYVI